MKKYKPKRFLGKDTIDYSLVWEPNDDYEHDLIDWVDSGSWEEDKPNKEYRMLHIIINGKQINTYTEPQELLRVTKTSHCYGNVYWYPNEDIDQEVIFPDNRKKYSGFYPWTCSCHSAGCAGIWDGVHLKVRGRSVEWRVKKNMGYDFLDKTFYQFDKQDYFAMIERLKGELK